MAGLLRDEFLPTTERSSRHAQLRDLGADCENAVAIWLGWVSMKKFDVPLAQ